MRMLHLLGVRDHIPLEQGLRHICTTGFIADKVTVRDHIPLEQGLRLDMLATYPTDTYSQRPYSIRTRIKTLE